MSMHFTEILEAELRPLVARAVTDSAFRRDVLAAGEVPFRSHGDDETMIRFVERDVRVGGSRWGVRDVVLPPMIGDYAAVSRQELGMEKPGVLAADPYSSCGCSCAGTCCPGPTCVQSSSTTEVDVGLDDWDS